jgi:hypothetical protein
LNTFSNSAGILNSAVGAVAVSFSIVESSMGMFELKAYSALIYLGSHWSMSKPSCQEQSSAVSSLIRTVPFLSFVLKRKLARGWRRHRGLMSAAPCSSLVTRHLSLLLTAAPALSTAASLPLLTRGRARASGSATGKIPSSSQWIRFPESHNADIPKRCLRHPGDCP